MAIYEALADCSSRISPAEYMHVSSVLAARLGGTGLRGWDAYIIGDFRLSTGEDLGTGATVIICDMVDGLEAFYIRGEAGDLLSPENPQQAEALNIIQRLVYDSPRVQHPVA